MPESRAVVRGAPLPRTLKGDLNVLWKAMLDRLIVTLPFGAPQLVIGGLQPTTNVGIWFKDGTKPYVWDEVAKSYIPADLTDSIDPTYWFGPDEPASGDPQIWIRTFAGDTRAAVYFYDSLNSVWTSANGIPASGATADRPATPVDFEPYWDTDINCLIHWERSQWRTVSGTPGDLKFVDTGDTDYSVAVAAALTRNPGWEELAIDYRGRAISIAGSGSGLTARNPRDVYGAETATIAEANLPAHTHSTTLQKLLNKGTSSGSADLLADNTGAYDTSVNKNSSSVGSGTALPISNPHVSFVCLKKL